MAAKLSPHVEHLVEEASTLAPGDLAALIEAIQSLPRREENVGERNAVLAERVARVRNGDVATLSLDEVEQNIRRDLDF